MDLTVVACSPVTISVVRSMLSVASLQAYTAEINLKHCAFTLHRK